MNKFGYRAIFAFVCIVGVSTISLIAEVKLRIYLQDGSLQAGNLINETDDSFIILSRSGRVDIPKDKIMFVNGKTLQQWKDRPDKFFQTEILPAEVPNPSFVNDKSLPPPPIAPTVKMELPKTKPSPIAKSEPEKVMEPKPTPIMAIPPPQELAPEKKVIKEVNETPKPSPIKTAKKPAEKTKSGSAKATEPLAQRPTAIKAKSNLTEQAWNEIKKPKKYSRQTMGEYHFERARLFINQNYLGRAIQELHIVTLLDRSNPEPAKLLAEIYVSQGNREKAERLLEHPLLKHTESTANMMAQLDQGDLQKQKDLRFMYGALGAAVSLSGMALVFTRRWRKQRRGTRVIDAEKLSADQTAEELVESGQEKELLSSLRDTVSELSDEPAQTSVSEDGGALPELESSPMFVSQEQTLPLESYQPNDIVEEIEMPNKESEPEPVPLADIKQPEVEKEPVVEPPEMVESPQEIIEEVALPVEEEVIEKQSMQGSFAMEEKELEQAEESIVSSAENILAQAESHFEAMEAERQEQEEGENEEALRQREWKTLREAEEAVQRGHQLVGEEKYHLAIKEYRTSLALNPEKGEAYLGLAYISFSQNNWNMAEILYKQVLSIDSESAEGLYGLGRVYLELNKKEVAISQFQAALEADPTFFDAQEILTQLGRLV